MSDQTAASYVPEIYSLKSGELVDGGRLPWRQKVRNYNAYISALIVAERLVLLLPHCRPWPTRPLLEYDGDATTLSLDRSPYDRSSTIHYLHAWTPTTPTMRTTYSWMWNGSIQGTLDPEPSLVVYQPNPAIRLMTDDPLPSPARAAHDHCHCHAPTRPDPIPAPDTNGIKCRHSHSRTRATTSFHIYLSCRTVPLPSSPSAGTSLVVSAFGYGPNHLVDLTAAANYIANYVLKYDLDGVDVD
ncbi:hypothetical protein B0H13DRAFT_2663665 [Mycena leptocephala]|nr:hypothetical protein B0H13DRAFT_2663665 [Mycena leptocephala]